jgi:hypothetical protein
MISIDDARRTLEADGFYVIQPEMDWWVGSSRAKGWDGAKPVPADFRYTSDTNTRWLTIEELRAIVAMGASGRAIVEKRADWQTNRLVLGEVYRAALASAAGRP